MNAHQFIETLSARGITLVTEPHAPSGIKVLAPPGVVTPPIARRIKSALPTLKPLIQQSERWEELRRLGAEVEALLTAELEAQETLQTTQALAHLPRYILDTPGPWKLRPGVTASSPARWLTRALERASALADRCGPHWWRDNPAGVALLVDLKAFMGWFPRAP